MCPATRAPCHGHAMPEAVLCFFWQFWSTPSSEVEDMRMMRKTALAASAGLGLAALAACSDSATAPTRSAFVPKSSFVVAGGTLTDNTPEVGKVKICKTGDVGGSFDVSRTAVGSPDIGTVSGANTLIDTGTCVLVAEDDSPHGVGSTGVISEDAAANT